VRVTSSWLVPSLSPAKKLTTVVPVAAGVQLNALVSTLAPEASGNEAPAGRPVAHRRTSSAASFGISVPVIVKFKVLLMATDFAVPAGLIAMAGG